MRWSFYLIAIISLIEWSHRPSDMVTNSYLVDSAGVNKAGVNAVNQQLVDTEGQKTTYSASAVIGPAATATDIFCISGSASKTIRVLRIQLSGQATATADVQFGIIVRSSADTGGSQAALTAVPHDSNSAAASASVVIFGGVPSALGTSVGFVRQQRMTLTTAAGAIPETPDMWDFGIRNGQAVVLRGAAQQLCGNIFGQTITGGAFSFDIEWSEE